MTLWLLLSSVTALGVLIFVLAPFRRGFSSHRHDDHREAVLAALRAERAQLQEDRAAGRIDEAAYQAALDELRARLLAETQEAVSADGAKVWSEGPRRAPLLAWTTAAAVCLFTAGLYLWVGSPQWADDAKVAQINAQAHAAAMGSNAAITPEQIRALVARLAERLAENPSDIQGWRMLARSYMVMEEADAVLATWAKLGSKIPDDPEVLLDWGELLAAANGSFTAEAVRLIEQAVAHHPPPPRALALAGAAAASSGNPQQAIAYWEQLLPFTEENAEARQAVLAAIAEERQKLASGR